MIVMNQDVSACAASLYAFALARAGCRFAGSSLLLLVQVHPGVSWGPQGRAS